MRKLDDAFYKTTTWKSVRDAYISMHPLCERCLAADQIEPAEVVHHKVHLTADNMTDPNIAYNFDNLQSLCRTCHEKIHHRIGHKKPRRFIVGDDGKIFAFPPSK